MCICESLTNGKRKNQIKQKYSHLNEDFANKN